MLNDLHTVGTVPLLGLAVLATLAILAAGTRLTGTADVLADRTGLGEALIGGVLLGASTSLSGTVTSVSAAWLGHPDLAFSNAIGGIAVQTSFLALADLVYRRATLAHAAASTQNVLGNGLLLLMLSIAVLASFTPAVTVFAIHPASIILVVVYIAGLFALNAEHKRPLWRPVKTRETREDAVEEDARPGLSTPRLVVEIGALALVLGIAGYTASRVALEATVRFGIDESVMGALATAAMTSTPELVVTLAAVYRGALHLAVGGIIGGNTYDVLFLTFSDIAYRDGSLYHYVTDATLYWLVVALVMASLVLTAQVRRELVGLRHIGIESIAIVLLYALAIGLAVLGP